MKTVSEILTLSTSFLQSKGVTGPRRVAEALLADVLNQNRLDLYLKFDQPLHENEINEIREKLSRLAKNEPWQYVKGEVEFYNCSLTLNSSVLIPRQETEILVDKIAKELAKIDLREKVLLDLCTGSGCIGISLKKKFPDLEVVLSDCSENALKVASQNAILNGATVKIVQGNFLEPFERQSFDYIVCNPPYIAESAYEQLDISVKNFEPKTALVAEEGGLSFYKRFQEVGYHYLKPQGKVWFEIGFDQGRALQNLFSDSIWKSVLLERDWSHHDRFFSLEIE